MAKSYDALQAEWAQREREANELERKVERSRAALDSAIQTGQAVTQLARQLDRHTKQRMEALQTDLESGMRTHATHHAELVELAQRIEQLNEQVATATAVSHAARIAQLDMLHASPVAVPDKGEIQEAFARADAKIAEINSNANTASYETDLCWFEDEPEPLSYMEKALRTRMEQEGVPTEPKHLESEQGQLRKEQASESLH